MTGPPWRFCGSASRAMSGFADKLTTTHPPCCPLALGRADVADGRVRPSLVAERLDVVEPLLLGCRAALEPLAELRLERREPALHRRVVALLYHLPRRPMQVLRACLLASRPLCVRTQTCTGAPSRGLPPELPCTFTTR